MKKLTIITTLALMAAIAQSAPLKFSGNARPAWTETPSAATGLEAVSVLYGLQGVTATYTASSASAAARVQVAVWDSRGAAYAEPLNSTSITRSGNQVTVSGLTDNTGYSFTEGNRTTYHWIIDYSTRPFRADALSIAAEQECGRAWLDFTGSAEPITYHGINGRSWTLSRDIELHYSTLEFNRDNFAYNSVEATETLESIRNSTINLEAPLCDTYFSLSGDSFLRFWGEEIQVTSPRYSATSVAAEVSAEQKGEKADNQVNIDTDGLGGSAPLEIEFKAVVTDAAMFHEWQFSPDEDFYDITMRTSQLEFTQIFNTMGTTYVRFTAANGDGSCQTDSEVFKVYIGESFLRCPNVFSPGSTEGTNDEWKVSYKSITSFECYIFNRWGQKMVEFHDPSRGWDGRFKGKLVPAGVYYYVIKATGSDNKKYNLSGDINIVGYTGE
ncbi:MAG: gliding motility-associated C-terminal domain-containing protein [Firmicutes bacterium]|nr:gliding motility-associated C-terminal domain-containing protein [Bacillota bacterium]MCM1401358.1 gliding motility-associated C-terminal domain-containing protein [Bacteroides sp.]MCM1477383.1 gliding motility-associated C-terminal domain-containing protein [Bacteroides sp.]